MASLASVSPRENLQAPSAMIFGDGHESEQDTPDGHCYNEPFGQWYFLDDKGAGYVCEEVAETENTS
jgi:hypothetical protein